ncbi:MAG: SPFH domain-containing protein [Clostridiales bacterium]|nr:SPFH domain-containing protein [Clostridiales bacterium]
MAIIDCVSWNPQGPEVVYAYKFPHDNLSTYTQLIVNESQVALMFSKGQLLAKFGPGKHTLDTENLPILRSFFGIPFGGKNPFFAQIWFVNIIETFNIPWHVGKLSVHDSDYQTQLPLELNGQYGVKVTDPEKFVIKMVGTKNIFTQRDLTEQFKGEFTTKVKSAVVQFMMQNSVGFKQISAFLDPLSQSLKAQLNDFCNNIGLDVPKFYVSDIDIDTSTPEGLKVKEAIATQSSMSITGHTWQQEQMFGTASQAINQVGGVGSGGNGNLLGGLLAISMMNNMTGGAANGSMMNPQFSQPTFGGGQSAPQNFQQGATPSAQPARMVYCSSCSKKFPSTSAFCPNCGNKYHPCPNCGSDNPEEAHRCVNCGTQLAGAANKCPHCNMTLPAGSTFCPGCGQPVIISSNTCSRCGSPLPPTAAFCPKCGNRRT